MILQHSTLSIIFQYSTVSIIFNIQLYLTFFSIQLYLTFFNNHLYLTFFNNQLYLSFSIIILYLSVLNSLIDQLQKETVYSLATNKSNYEIHKTGPLVYVCPKCSCEQFPFFCFRFPQINRINIVQFPFSFSFPEIDSIT